MSERLLLAQQRRGYRSLRFAAELEAGFAEHRVQRIRRRLPLIAPIAALFQLIYALLDFLLMPLPVSLSVLPLRMLALAVLALSFFYCRRVEAPPARVPLVYAAAYWVNGVSVALIVHLCWQQGVEMPYDGLFLILLFGYALLGLSFRAISLCSWSFCLLFIGVGVLFGETGGALAYQGLFLFCANLIGSVGAYMQEHGQRGAWLNLRLLDLARQRAEADDARKLRLLAAASHDLRQPLNAMGLYAEHLVEQGGDLQTRRISSRLAASVEQLGRLLQSLLDYTRLTLPGGVQARSHAFALRPLLERLIAEVAPEAQQQELQLELHCDECGVYSDPLLLERLLRNLLNNALLHAQAQHLRLSAAPDGDEIVLEVADDGRGLSEAEQALVFEEFRQLDNPGRNAERGLGLGLAIVRQLAEVLEHPLHLHSQPGAGARFVLRLPLAEVPVAAPRADTGLTLQGRVLLLEDDPAGREALAGLLRRWGCEVQACADLTSALQVLRVDTPQLLISDYRLAEQEDGLQAIERLREAAGLMLPALLISADLSPELHERCLPAHVIPLGKPLLPARLRQVLATQLRARQTVS
ncbi:hybrid sensor histidine kinase/response regulator [Pseudomonas sp. zfem001]|uniref:hybrid sensor histidine kinase/response regulator n=1 Tax=Pseudomonas sp. zfem001 TaxID=3078196 RepID=UPI002929E13C|nr:hybrid sensor histidine kinase/response regulator [Pseudomonas sp. zfem001]MDU9410573.1 hybrid sensor histidine kinase/response regulator [Pseudomonas sp. zfem001]